MIARGRRRLLLPALAAGLLVTGLAAAGVAPTAARAAPARPGTPSVQIAPPVPVLDWRSCDGGFQCATARVPLDYRYPRAAMISIAVVRHLASDSAHREGTLFVNAGGPSEQIQGVVAGFAAIPAELRERFDIITFDPRGFGFSTAVRCFPSMDAENAFLAALPPFPVGARQDAQWEQAYARFDALCAQRNGSLLDHDTTADVARDMNLLRQAVGAPRLNYIGLSYGTGLGAIYANLFPATTGRMVFDGNLNPVTWTSGGPLPGGMRQGQDLAIAATLRSFLNLCGKTSPASCAFSAGTPAATRAKFATLLDRLLRHPVTLGNPPQTFTYADTLTDIPLGTESQWQQGAALLQQLWTASAAVPASGAAPGHGSAATTTGPVYTGQEQLYAVTCPDESDPHGASDYVAAARLAQARAGGYGLFDVWNEEPCADWPGTSVQDRYTGPWNRPTASTILLIGNTGDPATSYQSSVAMSRDLAHARLLTVREFGHTEFFNPDTCATNDEVSYITTGALPPVGTVCPPDGTPFPAPSS